MKEYRTYQANWQGIPLSVSYCPDWSPAYREAYGYSLAHLTVSAACGLPITETGSRSHFTRPERIDAEGGPVGFVLAWLAHDEGLPDWQRRKAEAAQLSLF